MKDTLERLYDKYNRGEFIQGDPISVPHGFAGREDKEISGFLAATIAWGNRHVIVRNAQRMMNLMDNAPYQFVSQADEGDMRQLEGFVHRTFNSTDLAAFVRLLREFYRVHGGIGAFFEGRYAVTGDLRVVLSQFRAAFFGAEHPGRCEKHLSSIDKGASCKRLNMYLRWMVRKDDRGVDFGLWERIPASALYLPLDVHSGNTARELGLLERTSNDWRAVEEVTGKLREFDPADPVRYDFALFGVGIDKGVK